MGALTRVVMDWLDRLINYHMLNGTHVTKYPKIDDAGHILLYYTLKKAVDSLGGYDVVSEKQLWKNVVAVLKLPPVGLDKSPMETVLASTYKDIILPFENYIAFLKFAGVTDGECSYKNCNLKASRRAFSSKKKVATPPVKRENSASLASDTALHTPTKRPRRQSSKPALVESDASDSDYNSDHDYYGSEDESPSNKKRRSPPQRGEESPETTDTPKRNLRARPERTSTASQEPEVARPLRRSSRLPAENVVVIEDEQQDQDSDEVVTICEVCEQACPEGEDAISCNECEGMFHKVCIASSQIFVQPKPEASKWYCSRCLVGSCEFAFEPGPVYTLGEFQDLAEDFRDDYLEKNPELQDIEDDEAFENEIERRFWESVGSAGDSITVEYGSDIHCSEKGSGFPVRAKDPYNRYSKDPWNLNNMPHHKDSLFHQIKSDISGMTVPWLYVGMMFSTFCWHSEDHYTYSVNYQHFGDKKTWYGIPGADAEKFEAAMRDTVPELFEKQPNLLFQLVTMLSPEDLVSKGVRCYAIDQGPGEFIITFPKAYHAGFNHGFNCNEAVNFAPPDWVAYGAESVDTYQAYNRAPVFSHDSLLVRTARVDLRPKTAHWLLPHIDRLVQKELAKRASIRARHPGLSLEQAPGEVSEEEYQCCVCNSLPYLSRVLISRNVRPKLGRRATSQSPLLDVEYNDDLDDSADLMELVFGIARTSDPDAESAQNDAKKPGANSNMLVVCDQHVPASLPKGFSAKMQIVCPDDELESLREAVARRADEYGEPAEAKVVVKAEDKEAVKAEQVQQQPSEPQPVVNWAPPTATV